MIARTCSRILCSLFVLTLACGTLAAQMYQVQRPKIAHNTNPSPIITPTDETPVTGLKSIFSNLGPTATNNYNDTTGYYVLGPNNALALSEQWIGLPFIPNQNGHVTQLRVAVGWISGKKQIIVGLYSDASGIVGSPLATTTVTAIPKDATCCGLATANITSTAVTKGTQYWIVATSDDANAPDFEGVWQSSNHAETGADVALGGWFSFSNNLPAAAASGTIP